MHLHLLKSLAMVAVLLFYVVGVYGIVAPWLVSARSTELTLAGIVLMIGGAWPLYILSTVAYNTVLTSIQEFSK